MTVILAFADLIFAKKCQHRYAHKKICFHNFNFREWYQDSRNLNPTKIMPYTVVHSVMFVSSHFFILLSIIIIEGSTITEANVTEHS